MHGGDPPLLHSADSLSLVLDQLDYDSVREASEVCKTLHAAVQLYERRGKLLCKIDFQDLVLPWPTPQATQIMIGTDCWKDWHTNYERRGVRFVGTAHGIQFGPSTGISEGDEGNWKLEGTSGSRFLGFNDPDQDACLQFRGRGISKVSFDAVCRQQHPMNVTAYAKDGTMLCCHNLVLGPAAPLYNSEEEDEGEFVDDGSFDDWQFSAACRKKQVDACYCARFVLTSILDAGTIAGSCTWSANPASASRAPAHECRMALREEDRIGALKITVGEVHGVITSAWHPSVQNGLPSWPDHPDLDVDPGLGLDNFEICL